MISKQQRFKKAIRENRLLKQSSRFLLEGEMENAQSALAAKDLVDRIQDMVTELGKMSNEDLPAVTDSIRSSFGADAASEYSANVGEQLTTLLTTVKSGRDSLENATLNLTGEGVQDAGIPAEPSLDGEDDGDGFASEPAATGGNEPLGRGLRDEAMSEGKIPSGAGMKKCTVCSKKFVGTTAKCPVCKKKVVKEAWGTKMHTPASKKGMFKGKSEESIKSNLNKLKKDPNKTAALKTKEHEDEFALRAKNHFGKIAEAKTEDKKMCTACKKLGKKTCKCVTSKKKIVKENIRVGNIVTIIEGSGKKYRVARINEDVAILKDSKGNVAGKKKVEKLKKVEKKSDKKKVVKEFRLPLGNSADTDRKSMGVTPKARGEKCANCGYPVRKNADGKLEHSGFSGDKSCKNPVTESLKRKLSNNLKKKRLAPKVNEGIFNSVTNAFGKAKDKFREINDNKLRTDMINILARNGRYTKLEIINAISQVLEEVGSPSITLTNGVKVMGLVQNKLANGGITESKKEYTPKNHKFTPSKTFKKNCSVCQGAESRPWHIKKDSDTNDLDKNGKRKKKFRPSSLDEWFKPNR